MIGLTRKSEYAIRGMLYLARQREGQFAMIDEIARSMQTPRPFLAKAFQMLANKGLIKSSKGQRGGFILARPPEMISLHDIIEAIDGKIMPNTCLIAEGSCSFQDTCAVHPVWRRIQNVTTGILEEVTLKSLARGV
jgi:Rrf2 family transcriptional regulator, iron-sulfur cluster assembly transcription factor